MIISLNFVKYYNALFVKALVTCLRCFQNIQLALNVPPPKRDSKSGMRIADKFVTWKEGEMFVFDDSFDHEVWNESEERIVLIVDFWHPDLTRVQRQTLKSLAKQKLKKSVWPTKEKKEKKLNQL